MLVLHQSHPLFLVMVLAGRYMLLFHLPCVQVQAPFCWKHSDITLKGLQDPSLWWQASYRLWHHVLSCPLSCLFCTWIEFICSGFSFELVSWCLNCFNSTRTLIRSRGVRLVPTMSWSPPVSSLTRTGCYASEGIIFLHGPLFVSECVCCFTCLGIMFSQIPNISIWDGLYMCGA